MKVTITGANGFIGQAMARHVTRVAPGSDIVGVVRDLADGSGDLPLRLTQKIEASDVLIHLAGRGGIPESLKDPAGAFDTSCRLAVETLEASRAAGVGCVVLVSTCAVYPFSSQPAREDGPLDLNSPYAEAKRAAEIYGLTCADLTGQDVRVARLANVYGPGQRALFIHDVARRALQTGQVQLQSNGLEKRDLIHVDDTADALWHVATKGRAGQIYNVGSGDPLRIIDVAKKICAALGADLTLPEQAPGTGDVTRDAFPATDRLGALGFRPARGFDDGLAETLDWIGKNT